MASKFTRRHYEALADVLMGVRLSPVNQTLDNARTLDRTVTAMADTLALDNPNFDFYKFAVRAGLFSYAHLMSEDTNYAELISGLSDSEVVK